MKYKILVCDDEKEIRDALQIYLKNEDFEVFKASDGLKAIDIVKSNEIHLILLDIMMPNMDGFTTAIKIREFSNIPIIFLSAKSEDTDRILGLNIGADDYITKPFNHTELIARVRANIRRYSSLGGIKDPTKQSDNPYIAGGLYIDDDKKKVLVDGEEVVLTATEYKILKLLVQNKDIVLSAKQIYEKVWKEPAFDVGKTISVHIRHIREKIEINPKEPRYLKIVYGLGYKVVDLK